MPKSNKSLGIIPARFASSRFPGKPLAIIAGKSMIRRVYEQASRAQCLGQVIVATDDERIRAHVQDFGGQALMTSPAHTSGTDRCAGVAALAAFKGFDVVVNIQGDEPFIEPHQIDLAVNALMADKTVPIATLARLIGEQTVLSDPNAVKVVFGKNGRALYFSRHAIPFLRNAASAEWPAQQAYYKHIGLYAFRRNALLEITALPPSPLEQAESLEQLRWLEYGMPIAVVLTNLESQSVDTPEDLENIEKHIRRSP
jgi:3-deoxy-manno-octulosonate cytidylyltransferase (CMP-KDO synthetase)